MRRLLLALLVPAALASCTRTNPPGELRVRVSALVDTTTLTLNATVEGPDGQALSGALVQATDPGGNVSLIPYNSSKAAYVATTPPQTGVYSVRVDSAAGGIKEVTVPVTVLASTPDVSDVVDGQGRSVRNFEKLQASTPIRVTWKAVDGANRYVLTIRESGRTLSSQTILGTQQTSAILPAGTFTGASVGSSASVTVTAIHQEGDPVYVAAPFVSVTSVNGTVLAFQVTP